MMRRLWGPVLDLDPYYNVNLSLNEPFSLAFPPRQAERRDDSLERDDTPAITRDHSSFTE